jgi:hypothetical protein
MTHAERMTIIRQTADLLRRVKRLDEAVHFTGLTRQHIAEMASLALACETSATAVYVSLSDLSAR